MGPRKGLGIPIRFGGPLSTFVSYPLENFLSEALATPPASQAVVFTDFIVSSSSRYGMFQRSALAYPFSRGCKNAFVPLLFYFVVLVKNKTSFKISNFHFKRFNVCLKRRLSFRLFAVFNV